LPVAESIFSPKRKTWLYYRNGVRRLQGFGPLASLPLDDPRMVTKDFSLCRIGNSAALSEK